MREPAILLGGDHNGKVVDVEEGQRTLVFPRLRERPRASWFTDMADPRQESVTFDRDYYSSQKWALGRGTVRRVYVHESLKEYEASTLMGMLLGQLYDEHLKYGKRAL